MSESTTIQIGIAENIREIIESRKRKYYDTFINTLILVPAVVHSVAAVVLKEWVLLIAGFAFSFGMITIIEYYERKYKIVVLTSLKSKEKSFFFRKKDELILSVVSAGVGALITFFLTKFIS